MFGNSLFGNFQNDPFFSGHHEHFQRMSNMDHFFGPQMLNRSPMLGLTQGHPGMPQGTLVMPQGTPGMPQGSQDPRAQMMLQQQRDPFGMFNMFGGMNSMMGHMQAQMQETQNNPNCHSYSSSTVMSYSNNGGDGQPQIYQATTSTKRAPGGVVETRKSVRDSEAAIDRMAVGHHIGDRGRTVEKTRHTRTGEMEEEKNLVNLDEDDLGNFDREWKDKTQAFNTHRPAIHSRREREHGRPIDRNPNYRRHNDVPAIMDRPQNPARHHRGDHQDSSRRYRDREDRN